MGTRLSFTAQHFVVHLGYLIYRALTAPLRWTRRLLRLLSPGQRSCGAATDEERAITIIANDADPRSRRKAFGLEVLPPYQSPLYNGHLQTILGGLRCNWAAPYTREVVRSDGGQRISIDYLYPASPSTARAMVVVLPGLLNASATNYISHFAQMATRDGFAVCVLNYRGMGAAQLEVPRLFSATFTEDIRYCLDHYLQPEAVQHRLGSRTPVPLIAAGFSLGGVMIIKYLGEQGLEAEKKEKQAGLPSGSIRPRTPIDAAFTITAPYDLVEADKGATTATYKRLYEKPFAVGLRKYARHNRAMLEKLPNVDSEFLFGGRRPGIDTITSIHLFDAHINAGHNGYGSPLEYYEAANPMRWLSHCRTPIVCLADRNDPVVGKMVSDDIWQRLVMENGSVHYVCFPVGGHLGFLGDPVAEWRSGKNEMERFVLGSISSFTRSMQQ